MDYPGWCKWQTAVNTVMNIQVLKNAGNFLTSRGAVSTIGSILLCVV
jgi:hypothetical protein